VTRELLVAGGGIGGLAAALAALARRLGSAPVRAGRAFSEVGAGIQLGPNATRILREWDLLRAWQAAPRRRACACATRVDGRELGALRWVPAWPRATARLTSPCTAPTCRRRCWRAREAPACGCMLGRGWRARDVHRA
jgi:hypothetical protein